MSTVETASNPLKSKWVQLALGVICMMSISSPQYVWALFTKPIMGQLGVSLTELQVTFSILIVLQTFFTIPGFLGGKVWSAPFIVSGYYIDWIELGALS